MNLQVVEIGAKQGTFCLNLQLVVIVMGMLTSTQSLMPWQHLLAEGLQC